MPLPVGPQENNGKEGKQFDRNPRDIVSLCLPMGREGWPSTVSCTATSPLSPRPYGAEGIFYLRQRPIFLPPTPTVHPLGLSRVAGQCAILNYILLNATPAVFHLHRQRLELFSVFAVYVKQFTPPGHFNAVDCVSRR